MPFNPTWKNKLVEISREYILEDNEAVVVKEPYIPHIPENWNRVLVLAESQNLSETNKDYVDKLRAMTSDERILRQYLGETRTGVYPWDDGSLKLALEAATTYKANDTGISNAVLWSLIKARANKNPDEELISLSVKIWGKFLKELNPKLIIAAGNIANSVAANAIGEGWEDVVFKVRLPSKIAMSRVSSMFNESDFLTRYHEVKSVADSHPEWLNDFRQNKIFFACHVVSKYKEWKS